MICSLFDLMIKIKSWWNSLIDLLTSISLNLFLLNWWISNLILFRLAKELSVLDGDNIYSMMASEDAVNNLMLHLATSIKEVNNGILRIYFKL